MQGTGNPGAALEQYKLAEKFSPSDPIIQDHIGQAYFGKRDFEQALKYYQSSLAREPRQGTAHYFIAKVHEERGDFMSAIQEFEQRDQAVGEYDEKSKGVYDDLRDAVRQGGAKGYWKKRLDTALREPQKNQYYIATFYARLGDKDNDYTWLKKACEQRAFDQYLLMFDLCWDHTDAQFQAVARKFGFMQ